jgi:alpha-L-fucosidase 2
MHEINLNRLLNIKKDLFILFLLGFSGTLISQNNSICSHSNKRYFLFDNKPAPTDLKGWESHSYPLGNGYFGVSFFGGVSEELWQFTEKSLHVRDPKASLASYNHSGLSSLCELRLVQNQDSSKVSNYRRELDIEHAIGWVSYQLDGVKYTRQSITSYPDRCFATKISASAARKVSFRLKAIHPYLCEFRTGTAEAKGNQLVLKAKTLPFNLKYEVRIAVTTKGGTVKSSTTGTEGEIVVDNANEAVIYVTLATNYKLRAESFTELPEDKLKGCEVPTAEIEKTLTSVLKKGWDKTLQSHEADIANLLGRMKLDLGGVNPNIPTRELLTATKPTPPAARYLEEVYFQYGRYLLVSSSRKGTLPANLQGTWNMLQKAPWIGGYWNNINIQMNYWPAFGTGLEDTFEPYYDIFKAAFPAHLKVAKETLEKWKCQPVEGAWTLGTSLTPYRISYPGGTSGAGTGPFVLLGMWEWYRYTGNPQVLEKIWPFMLSSSKFLAAVLKEQPDGSMPVSYTHLRAHETG